MEKQNGINYNFSHKVYLILFVMAALCNRCGHYIFALWFLSYFHTWCGLSANLECMFEICCMWLAGNAGPKKSPKMRHLGTIVQLCQTISSQLRHVSTIWKNLVKHQYLLHMSWLYDELRPTNGWDLWVLGTPANFNRFRILAALLHGTLVVGVSKPCGVEQRAPPIFGRAAITLDIGPHCSYLLFCSIHSNERDQRQSVSNQREWSSHPGRYFNARQQRHYDSPVYRYVYMDRLSRVLITGSW